MTLYGRACTKLRTLCGLARRAGVAYKSFVYWAHLEILWVFLLEKKLLQFGSVQLVQVVGDGLVCP